MVREETVAHLRPPQQHSGRMLGILLSLLNLMIMSNGNNVMKLTSALEMSADTGVVVCVCVCILSQLTAAACMDAVPWCRLIHFLTVFSLRVFVT